MESDRAHNIKINPGKRSKRTKATRSTRGDERDIMDITNRSSLERYATAVSAISNLPPAFSEVGKTGSFPRHSP
jgi:hypothetical protein